MTARIAEPQARRWTREEFYRLAEDGWFNGQRVQLLNGRIIQMPPQGHAHAKALSFINTWLNRHFADRYWIRIQMPLSVAPDSDPEPDAAVIEGDADRIHPGPAHKLSSATCGGRL